LDKELKRKREKRYAEKKKKQQKDVYLQYERQVNTKKTIQPQILTNSAERIRFCKHGNSKLSLSLVE